VNVLFPTGDRISYEIPKDATVGDLIQRIRDDPNAKKPANRVIVIIYQGRILQSNDLLSSIENLDDCTLHAFFRAMRVEPVAESAVDLRGFDRLSRMNYSASQIAELRQNFHVLHGTVLSSQEAQLDAEEEWFPVIFNHENPLQDLQLPQPAGHPPVPNPLIANEDEDQGDRTLENFPLLKFICGLVIGLMFGIGSLVFLLISLHDGPFLLGLFGGTCGHYALKYYFEMDLW
jgi:hypothetical protein